MNDKISDESKCNVINTIARALNMDSTIPEYLIAVRQELFKVYDVTNFSVYCFTQESDVLTELIHYANDTKKESNDSINEISHSQLIKSLIGKKKATLFTDKKLFMPFGIRTHGNQKKFPNSIIGVPFLEDNKLLGFIVLQSFESENTYSETDLDLLSIVATHIGLFTTRKRTEVALKKSEENYRALMRGNPDVIFRLDSEGNILDFQASPEDLILPQNNFKNATIKDVLSPEQGIECMSLIQSVIQTGKVQLFHHDIWHKNTQFHFEGRIVKNGENEVLMIVRNITEQTKAEIFKTVLHNIALKSNSSNTTVKEFCEYIHGQIAQLMDVSNFFISQLKDNDNLSFTVYSDVNYKGEQPYTRKLGNGLCEYIFRTRKSLLLTNGDIEKFQKENNLVFYSKTAKCWVGAPLMSSGKVIGVIACQSYTDGNIYDESHLELLTALGNQIGLMIDRKRAEEDQESFVRIFENSMNEIFIFNAETLKFKYVNKSGLKNIGYSLEEICQLSPISLSKDFESTEFTEMVRPMVSGELPAILFESTYQRQNGTTYPIEINLQYCTFKGDNVFVANILDITERRKQEEKTNQSFIDLQLIDQINRASLKNATIKELAHEILDIHQKIIPISRGRFYLFEEETTELEFIDEWSENDIIQHLEEKSGIHLEKIIPSLSKESGFFKVLEDKEMLVLKQPESIREIMEKGENDLLKKFFDRSVNQINILTFIVIPFVSENKIFGLMTLSSKENLSEVQINRIRLFNNQITAALAKTKVEQEISHQKKFNEEVLNNIPVDIVVFDKNQNYLFINPEAVKNDETRNWLIGKNDFDYAKFKGISENKALKRNVYFKKAILAKTDIEFVDEHQMEDGSTKYMLRKFHPYFENSVLKLVIGYGVDITKMMQTEKSMEEFTKQLELKVEQRTSDLTRSQEKLEMALEKEKQLGELKSRFVTTASHQFRTPMSIIQSNSDLLAMMTENSDMALRPKLEKAVDRIQREIKRMTNLMDDILILGKITAGKVNALFFQPTDLLPFCKELVEGYNEIQTTDRRFEVEYTGRQRKVSIDQKLMNHAISNLISNALKYSTKGNPKICLEYNKEEVKILVIDQGIGIPAKEMRDLFEPFHRGENVGSISGTGLGLTIVKEYVELNHGKITAESILNEKTIFTLTFPYIKKIKL